MSLESATYINTLNVANPAATDNISQADDHIRMLKSVLKSTFPNVTGAVTPTHTQMNQALVPIGGVIMWSGDPSALPTGWKLCDGGTYARSDGAGNITAPDLRSKFVMGCGGSTALPTTSPTVGSTGGASSNTPAITMTNAGTVLTQAQLPNVSLAGTVTDPGHIHAITDPGHRHTIGRLYDVGTPTGNYANSFGYSSAADTGGTYTSNTTTGVTVNSAVTGISVSTPLGSGQSHTHSNTAACAAVPTIPPYYTLAFIIKV